MKITNLPPARNVQTIITAISTDFDLASPIKCITSSSNKLQHISP